MTKHWFTAALLLFAAFAPARAADALPTVNLRIEWRWAESGSLNQQGADLRGGVSVGTGGVVDPQGSLSIRSNQHSVEAESVRQLLVLNGGHASLRLSQGEPVDWVELYSTPRGGGGGVVRQAWVESGLSVEIRPRWRGGRAPVELGLAIDTAQRTDQTTAAQRREAVQTELQLTPGLWTTVARSGRSVRSSERGTLSTMDAEHSSQRELQLRVITP